MGTVLAICDWVTSTYKSKADTACEGKVWEAHYLKTLWGRYLRFEIGSDQLAKNLKGTGCDLKFWKLFICLHCVRDFYFGCRNRSSLLIA